MAILWFRNLFLKFRAKSPSTRILPFADQIEAWQKASHRMKWRIPKTEFKKAEMMTPPKLGSDDRIHGYIGTAIFFGFGDDGRGNADPVQSAEQAWNYALKSRSRRTWRCEYIDFQKPQNIRLRPGAPARPKDFYVAKIQPGERHIHMTVSQVRKKFTTDTGWGPEGFQFLAITHPHFADLMNERKIPFMALADYDVAPYGYNDFYDAPQLFCSNNKLGLGIGNVDRNYPLFGIPTLQLCGRSQV
jgi:hypothetical protein